MNLFTVCDLSLVGGKHSFVKIAVIARKIKLCILCSNLAILTENTSPKMYLFQENFLKIWRIDSGRNKQISTNHSYMRAAMTKFLMTLN